MTCLVVVGGGFANKGAEAMLKTVRSELSTRLGDMQVVLWDARADELASAIPRIRDGLGVCSHVATHENRMVHSERC